jgi:hypothetical protein
MGSTGIDDVGAVWKATGSKVSEELDQPASGQRQLSPFNDSVRVPDYPVKVIILDRAAAGLIESDYISPEGECLVHVRDGDTEVIEGHNTGH